MGDFRLSMGGSIEGEIEVGNYWGRYQKKRTYLTLGDNIIDLW